MGDRGKDREIEEKGRNRKERKGGQMGRKERMRRKGEEGEEKGWRVVRRVFTKCGHVLLTSVMMYSTGSLILSALSTNVINIVAL